MTWPIAGLDWDQMSLAPHPLTIRIRALVCLAALLASVPAAMAARAPNDWERVLEPGLIGKRVKLVLHKDQAVNGEVVVKGRLSSAAGSSIEIVTSDGNTQTFNRDRVRELRVHVPYGRRFALGSVGASSILYAGGMGILVGALAGSAEFGLGFFIVYTPGSTPFFALFNKTRRVYKADPPGATPVATTGSAARTVGSVASRERGSGSSQGTRDRPN